MRIALLSVIAILVVLGSAPAGKATAFPKNEPYFDVSLPEGWLTQTEPDASIKFVADNKTPLVTVIRRVKAHTDEELKSFMNRAAQNLGKNLKDLKVSDVTEVTTSNKVTMFELKVTGTDDGEPTVFVMSGFSPRKGIYFIASVSTNAKVFSAHEKEYRQVVNAIAPLP